MTGLRFALGAPVRRDHRRAVVTARSYVTRRYDLRYADGQTELSVPEPDLRPEGGAEKDKNGGVAFAVPNQERTTVAPIGSVRWFTNLAHPRRYKERLILVLRAYLDASGEFESDRVVSVAGFVASEQLWCAFEQRWQKFLKSYDLKRFHAAPYLARKRPFNGWDDKKYQQCGLDVCDVFKWVNPIGAGNAVDVDLFQDWRAEQSVFIHKDPYYFCLETCLRFLIQGITQHPTDEGIAIYIDQDNGRDKLGYQLAEWQEARLRRAPGPHVDPRRQVSSHYVSSVDFLPLQAADILAHGSFQWMRDFLLNRKTHPEPYFVECMRRNEVPFHVNYFHSKELLDIELRKRIGGSSSEERSS